MIDLYRYKEEKSSQRPKESIVDETTNQPMTYLLKVHVQLKTGIP
jgi:hypothetical protein